MRRTVTLAALTALVVVALPVAPAVACSPPIRTLDVDRTEVTPGSRLSVSGKAYDGDFSCPPMTPPPTASETGTTEGPTETASETPPATSSETATAEPSGSEEPSGTPEPTGSGEPLPLRPVAYVVADTTQVRLAIASLDSLGRRGPERAVGTATATRRHVDGNGGGYDEWRFATTITVPGDVAPGRYELTANDRDGRYYGSAFVTVREGLANTGARALGLAALGALLVLTGAGVTFAARSRRAG